jgi:hypothetical protein
MAKSELTRSEFEVRVLKLKHQVDGENVWQGEKDLAHKYLNKVLDILDEYKR